MANAYDEAAVTGKEFRFATSLRHLQDGVVLRTHAVGTYRTTVSRQRITVEPRLWGPRFDIAMQNVERIENTGRGIRIMFRGDGSPILVGTLRHRKLVDAILATCPKKYDAAVRRSGLGQV